MDFEGNENHRTAFENVHVLCSGIDNAVVDKTEA